MKTLQEYRRTLNLTQAQFGQRLGVSGPMIGMWERGERTPSGTTLMKIAAEFDVVVKITNGSFFFIPNDEYVLKEQDVRKDAEQHKASMPSMYFGSYQLPNGNWQGVLAGDDEQEITEILSYYDHLVPTKIRATKYGRGKNSRYDLTSLVDDDSLPTSFEKPKIITVSSGDPNSKPNPSIDGDKKAKEYERKINKAVQNPDVKQEMQDPNTLFGIMKNLVQVVARGARNSLVVYGGPGTGKSYTVFETLKQEGLQRGSDYYLVKGRITTSELYKHLFMHRKGKIIVFDDTDSVWSDKDAANMLKAALDSYDERVISWYSGRTFNVSTLDEYEKEQYNQKVEDELGDPESKVKFPSEFLYEGRIIFISNLPYEKFDSAVLTRSAKIDMSLTQEQMFQRMEGILEHLGDADVSIEAKREILEFLKEENRSGKLRDISMRTFTAAQDLYKSGLPNWKELLGYV